MKKSKFIEDEMTIQYKKNLMDLNAKINPKPSAEEREQLRQKYLERRNVK